MKKKKKTVSVDLSRFKGESNLGYQKFTVNQKSLIWQLEF